MRADRSYTDYLAWQWDLVDRGVSCLRICGTEEPRVDTRSWDSRLIGVENGPARERLRRWGAAGGPTPDLDRLCILGDSALEHAVRTTVALAPQFVGWFVQEHLLFVGTGAETLGWAASGPALPPCRFEPMHIVAIAGGCNGKVASESDLQITVAHEIGHCLGASIHATAPSAPPAPYPAARLARAAVALDRVDYLADLQAAEEVAADNVASVILTPEGSRWPRRVVTCGGHHKRVLQERNARLAAMKETDQ